MPKKQGDQPKTIFQGFRSPNYTQVPDELFDELLPELSGAELKALLYIIRRTFGFKRDSDTISLSQMLNGITTQDGRVLDRGVGLSKPTLLQALRSLQEKNIILTERRRSLERGDEPTVYCLRLVDERGGQKTQPPVVKKLYQGGGEETLPGGWSKNLTTQETVEQETVKQHTVEQQTGSFDSNISNLEKTRFKNSKSNLTEDLSVEPIEREHSAAGLAPVGELLKDRSQRLSRDPQPSNSQRSKGGVASGRGRPPKLTEQLEYWIDKLSGELHDEEHTASNRGQLARLWHGSGLSESAMVQLIGEAASRTKQAGNIKKRASIGGELGFRNKMPFFFACLRDLLGMKEEPGRAAPPS